jgi:hypothetical protein
MFGVLIHKSSGNPLLGNFEKHVVWALKHNGKARKKRTDVFVKIPPLVRFDQNITHSIALHEIGRGARALIDLEDIAFTSMIVNAVRP